MVQQITLDDRQVYELEMLSIGAYFPLRGFMKQADYLSVVHHVHLATGELWSLPVVLPLLNLLSQDFPKNGDIVELKNEQNIILAKLKDVEVYSVDLALECEKVYGTPDDTNHPYVGYLYQLVKEKNKSNDGKLYYLGGEIEMINPVRHYDFPELRLTPMEIKEEFIKRGWKTIVGFQTRNPLHRSHFELTKYAMRETGDPNAKLFLNPVVGPTQNCDVNYFTRVRCYQKLVKYYEPNTCLLALLPLAMRMAGPREALHHALIRQNYGCTHFIIGRDHAGPSYKTREGKSFYGSYQAQDFVNQFIDELKISILTSKEICYVPSLEKYLPRDQIPEETPTLNLSGTEQRRLLETGSKIPDWFSFPDIIEELRKAYKFKWQQGIVIYLIGLSGAGKSTLANNLETKLKSLDLKHRRQITILDGDIVRQNLSRGLGFSREDRSANVRRIGFVASQIAKHGGICLCANIAPYEEDRKFNRELIESEGGNYIEIYLSTSLEVCEMRDTKGLYASARAGKIGQFTGISDPFEPPLQSDLVLNSNTPSDLDNNLEIIIRFLQNKELLL